MNNFAVLTIAYIYVDSSIIIRVTTNNPVHLTCYYTESEPGRHKTSRTQRGLTLPWGVYFCFDAWKSIEQNEPGDTLIHTFEIPSWFYCQTKWFAFRGTVEAPPPTYDFDALKNIAKVWEPWGEILNENYPWLPYTIPNIPEWSLENGILTLTNPGYADCGIAYSPPYNLLPLLDATIKPLSIMVNNPHVTTNSSSTQIYHELIFRSPTEVLSIYLAVALGAEWDYYKPQYHTVIRGRDCGIFWIGPGYHNINLHQLFIKFRTEFGKSTDPAGWWLNDIVLVMSLGEEHRTDSLKSDYLALYYPPLPVPTHNLSPSVSPIFRHHRIRTLITTTFYPDAHPETTSVDGRVQHRQLDPQLTWHELRASPGNSANSVVVANAVIISASAWVENVWWTLTKSIELFDTSSLGITAVPISAFVSIMGHVKLDGLNTSPTLALFSSNPLGNTFLLPEDFTSLGVTPLSQIMSYADFNPDGRNIFTLNPDGLLAINRTGITKLGFREYTHDVLGNTPNFVFGETSWFQWFSADQGHPDKPELTITYAIP